MAKVPPGTYINNRYEVTDYLGGGNFGEVYRVLDHHQQHVVALKLLDPTKLSGWPWSEPAKLTALRSEYVLSIWNADMAAGAPFIVTDLALGGTADQLLTPSPPDARVALKLAQDFTRGTVRTHDEGVLHRDIKLENVFLDAHGRARLGDFGLAWPMDAAGKAPPAGTPAMTAPEVLAGGECTVRSDIYSIGASLYRLLSGRWPYEAHIHDVAALRAASAAGGPAPLRDLAPHVSRGVAIVVERAMARDPLNRYSSAHDLDAALGAVSLTRRLWRRVPNHAGHVDCWESIGKTPDIAVCVETSGSKYNIHVVRRRTSRRIRKHCHVGVPHGVLLGRLRGIFERLS